MADLKQFRMPDAGEGLTEAEIVSWRVRPGETVSVNQTIVEVETAKSLVELPSPFAGRVVELLAAEGESVDVGTPIITVDVDPGSAAGGPDPAPEPARVAESADTPTPAHVPATEIPPAEGAVEPGLIGGVAPGGRTSVLVGYGPRTGPTKRRQRVLRPQRGDAAAGAGAARSPEQPAQPEPPDQQPLATVRVLAKPPVRRLARDLGVDLAEVRPSGPGGVVTRGDVTAAADVAGMPDVAGEPGGLPAPSGVPAPAGPGERTRVTGVRKATATAMVASAFTAPHVTEWVSVDVTRTVRLVRRLRDDEEFAGVRVSPLLLVAKALLIAVRRHPGVNASWQDSAGGGAEIVTHPQVNLGIAVATPRGLLVPSIKAAERLTLRELAGALGELTRTARAGRTPPADLAGGTITITNVGVFGIDGGTPILNPGEAAILAAGQIRQLPWVHRGKVRPRAVMQLSLSFDHRLVDGDLGSRFLADIAAVLERPGRAIVWS